MILKRERVMWDEGWSGKHVHSFGGGSDPDPVPRDLKVYDEDRRPFMFVVDDGVLYGCYTGSPLGFVR